MVIRKRVDGRSPQGSLMGPVSWNITFETQLQRLHKNNVEAVTYADDCVIVTARKTYNEANFELIFITFQHAD